MAQSTIQITDYANEKSSFGLTSTNLTAANFNAQVAAAEALATATSALTIGNVTKQTIAAVLDDSPAVATNPYAHREMKWLVTYQAVTSGKLFQTEIAAPDVTDNLVPNSDQADLASDDWVAWIAAFVAFAKSPDDPTDAVIVVSAVLVGRNI